MRLQTHEQTPSSRHVKVKGSRQSLRWQPDYWSSRMGDHPEVPKRVGRLLKKQKVKFAHCGLDFVNHFYTDSDGQTVGIPWFGRQGNLGINRALCLVSGNQKGSQNLTIARNQLWSTGDLKPVDRPTSSLREKLLRKSRLDAAGKARRSRCYAGAAALALVNARTGKCGYVREESGKSAPLNPLLNALLLWRREDFKWQTRSQVRFVPGCSIGSFPWERKFNNCAFAKGKAAANVRALTKINSSGSLLKGTRARAKQTLA